MHSTFQNKINIIFSIGLMVWLLSSGAYVSAQKKIDTSRKIPITILKNNYMEGIKTDSNSYFKFVGDVQFQHGTDMLYCDSAILNQEKNNLEAFGNVKIVQANGTTAMSDYLSYTGNIKKAYLKGNVSLSTNNDHLWTEELDYYLITKVGNYYHGGTLQSGSTTLSSNLGTYNAQKKEARFVEDVLVNDTAFNIESKDLGYNTETKMMRFFDSSIVTNTSFVLRTTVGIYDSKYQIAEFISRSSILNNEQYIEGDSLFYNKKTGIGKALGNVIVLDTAQQVTLYCGSAFYNDQLKTLLAIDKPVLKRVQENDSLFTRADTFYSAHFSVKKELQNKSTSNKGAKKKKNIAVNEGNPELISIADTTSPQYYCGYHNVRIFSDSLQGKCDSVCFSGKDSTMMLMKNPIIWSRKSQISGDTIIAFIQSGKVSKVVVPSDALIVSRSGPEQANLFNQVQGKTLIAYMVNEALDNAIVKPDAESIYYPTDDSGAYIGVSQSQSERMKIFFKDSKINKLLLEQEVKQTLSPLNKIDIENMRLSRFKWLDEYRPKSIIELFE
ncbi:MAG: OstA-like protein [Phycisphaerales bacterium]|nr:OstA-like protein [Phycisphaerales bacterium]